MSKTNPDFTGRIAQFSRRSNVECIALVLHITKEQTYSNKIVQLGKKKILNQNQLF